jgi:hypothetical protein
MTSTRTWIACLLCLGSCDDGPVPVDGPSGAYDEPAAVAQRPVLFAGVAVLRGEVATATTGALYVILRTRGSAAPAMARRYDLDDPALGAMHAGARRLAFELTLQDDMLGQGSVPPGELELEVRFDRDGDIGTKDDTLRAVAPTRAGETGLELVLAGP